MMGTAHSIVRILSEFYSEPLSLVSCLVLCIFCIPVAWGLWGTLDCFLGVKFSAAFLLAPSGRFLSSTQGRGSLFEMEKKKGFGWRFWGVEAGRDSAGPGIAVKFD